LAGGGRECHKFRWTALLQMEEEEEEMDGVEERVSG
jgi:hypothetical protein